MKMIQRAMMNSALKFCRKLTPGGGDSHMKKSGMLIGKFELTL